MGVSDRIKPFNVGYTELPVEVRLMIKAYISDWDLRTHAALYLASPVTAAIYDNTPDEFWKLACWMNGIGLLPWEANKADDEICWRDIALDCIRRDGFCKHPICGGRLLAYNHEKMQEAAATGLATPDEPADIRGEDNDTKLTAHNVFEWIGFRPSAEMKDRGFRVDYDAQLLPVAAAEIERGVDDYDDHELEDERSASGDPMDINAREYLARHPLVARSFATSIPLDSISFCYVHNYDLEDHDWAPEHGRAVTVMDVLGIIQRDLQHELTRVELAEFVRGHSDCLHVHGWNTLQTLDRLKTLRDTFSLCRLSGVRHICNEDSVGPAFNFEQL